MVTAKLISAFVFATLIVQFLYFLNPKFQASRRLLWLYSPVCVGLVYNPEGRFSHDEAQMCSKYQKAGTYSSPTGILSMRVGMPFIITESQIRSKCLEKSVTE